MKIHVTALQKKTLGSPWENMEKVTAMLEGRTGPPLDFILLPEIFTCPYDNACFPLYAQEEEGEVCRFLSDLSRREGAYLIGGSVPERDGEGRIYNTSYIYDREGRQIGKHRKVHLFDIDVEGGQYFKESDVLSPGDKITVFDTEFGKMGVCICFDIRFPEMFIRMRREGVRAVFVPAAFNMTTGPAHWETLFRARALDQQIFMIGCSPARDEEASYRAYGHSIVTDPWGRVVCQLDHREGILEADLDLDLTDLVRRQIPLSGTEM